MSEEEVKAILDGIKPAWEHVTEAVKQITAAMGEMVQTVIDGIAAILDADWAVIAEATPKERHYILHAKKWRIRKKYYDRARRRMLARTGREETGNEVSAANLANCGHVEHTRQSFIPGLYTPMEGCGGERRPGGFKGIQGTS